MNNAEKIAIKIFQNGRNTTKGSAVSKHLIRKGVDRIEAHTNQTLQELKAKVEDAETFKEVETGLDFDMIAKEEIITLIDEAINE